MASWTNIFLIVAYIVIVLIIGYFASWILRGELKADFETHPCWIKLNDLEKLTLLPNIKEIALE